MNPNETYTREQTDAKGQAWMELYAKAEEGVQAVLKAQAAREKMAEVLESDDAPKKLKAQAKTVDEMSEEFIKSMVATGRTLVQIISEPTKPLSKLVTLHNIMEHSEGPPNQPWLQVYTKVATEIDATIASFDTALEAEMTKYEKLAK
jgi:hypothetical protein